ncbi:retention module-containing protein, partial [Niveibacterium sp. 24ML]|uniref:retention module-containing protein n=1 Tax=Niveibacterium sp. 24ML TaxID=2985512 RepID=UPI00226E9E5A
MATTTIRAEGLVAHLEGKAWVRNADGSLREVRLGDRIAEGQVIVTEGGARLELRGANGDAITVGGGREVLADAAMLTQEAPAAQDAALAPPQDADIDRVIASLNAGADPLAELDATAAGLGGGSGGDGNSFVRLLRITEGIDPLGLEIPTTTQQIDLLPTGAADADPNVAPETTPLALDLPEDSSIGFTIDNLVNDPNGDPVSVIGTPTASIGVITVNTDGTYLYTPPANYNGPATITYTVSDSRGGETTGTISVNVTPVNDAPEADNLSVTTLEDTPVAGRVPARDVDGDTLSFAKGSDPANGSVVVNADGTWTYTPTKDYNGPDSFTVTVSDGKGGTTTATVNIGVTPVNDAPSTTNISVLTPEDTPVSGTVTATDLDGDTLSFAKGSDPVNGSVVINTDGTWTYTPATDYNGPDSFTVTVSDGKGGTTTATINVGVTPVNDAPIAIPSASTGTEDNPINVSLAGSDVDGSVTGVTVTRLPASGTLYLADGSTPVSVGAVLSPADAATLVFRPAPDFNGTVDLQFTVTDNQGAVSSPATATIEVTPVVDPLITINDVSVNEAAGTISFTVTLSEATTAPVSVNWNTAPGTASAGSDFVAGSGTLNFAPGVTTQTVTISIPNDGTYEGPESFSVQLSGATNGVIADGSGIGTIVDDGSGPTIPGIPADDDRPLIAVSDAAAVEGDFAVFTVSLSNPSTTAVTFAPSISSGTASVGTDTASAMEYFNGASWVAVGAAGVTLAAGETSVQIRVATTDDALVEVDENFNLNATVTGGVTKNASASGTGTISDDAGPGNPSGIPGPEDTVLVSIAGPASVVEGSNTTDYTVSLSQAAVSPVIVQLSYSGTASDGSDYTKVVSITVPAGATSATFNLATLDDALVDSGETITVSLSTISGGGFEAIAASPVANTVTTTITDDAGPGNPSGVPGPEDTVQVSIAGPASVVEGNVANGYTVTLSQAAVSDVTVQLSYTGTAADGSDFTGVVSVVVPAGVSSATFNLATLDDAIADSGETIVVGIGAISGGGFEAIAANPLASSVTTTISDESLAGPEDTVSLSLTASPAVAEGGSITYTATLSQAAAAPLTVTLSNEAQIIIAAGATSGTVSVAAPSDDVYIDAGNVSATIANTLGGGFEQLVVNAAAAVTAISDTLDTTTVTLSGDAQVAEGSSANYTLALTAPAQSDVQVTLSYTGTAANGIDFSGTTTVTIPAGSSNANFSISTLDDVLAEGSESFTVTLAGATGGAFENLALSGSSNSVTTVIVDNDTPTLSISDAAVIEGDFAVFTVTLSNAGTGDVTFSPSLIAGTATPGTDTSPAIEYFNGSAWLPVPPAGITIAAGDTSVQVRVATTDDALAEVDEYFSLRADVTGGLVANASATGTATISDEATPDTVLVSLAGPSSVVEGASTSTYTVTLSQAAVTPVTVNLTYSGTATDGTDYTKVVSVTIPAGSSSATFSLPTTNDTLDEPNETIIVTIGGVSGGGFEAIATNPAANSVTTTITDNDAAPSIASISSPTATEGSDLVYTIALTNGSSVATTYPFTLGGGSAAATDYGTPTFSNGVTLAGGMLSVPAGVTSFTMTLPTTQDALDETNETVPVTVGGVTGTGTITDDDATPSLSVNDVTVDEAAGTMSFTVTLSAASGQSVSVNFATSNGSATAGSDYTATTGTLTFTPGTTTQTITVPIANDTLDEPAETLNVSLSGAVNATIADGSGVGTITDNDAAPSIASISSPTATEGSDLVYTIALTNGSSVATTYPFALGGGSAAATDYGTPTFSNGVTLAGGVLSVPAGVTSFTMTLPTTQDALDEINEAVPLTVGGVTGTGTITDDDATPSLSVNDVTVDEAAGTMSFTVTLSAASGQSVSVNFATSNGSATAGSDYTATTGTLTFTPGTTTQTITVPIANDT